MELTSLVKLQFYQSWSPASFYPNFKDCIYNCLLLQIIHASQQLTTVCFAYKYFFCFPATTVTMGTVCECIFNVCIFFGFSYICYQVWIFFCTANFPVVITILFLILHMFKLIYIIPRPVCYWPLYFLFCVYSPVWILCTKTLSFWGLKQSYLKKLNM